MIKFERLDFGLAQLNPKHIPKDEYERIFENSSKDSGYCFMSMFFDEGMFIYLFSSSSGEKRENTKIDFPVFYSIIEDLYAQDFRLLLFFEEVPLQRDLQIYEH